MNIFYRVLFGTMNTRTVICDHVAVTGRRRKPSAVSVSCVALYALLAIGCGQQVYTHDAEYEVIDGFVSGEGDRIELAHVVNGYYDHVPSYLNLNALPAFEQAFDIREVPKLRAGGTYVNLARQIDASDGASLTLEVDTSVELGTYEEEDDGSVGLMNGIPDLHITTVTFAPQQAAEVLLRNQFYVIAPDQAPHDPPLRVMILVDTNDGQQWVYAAQQQTHHTPGLAPGGLNRIDITLPHHVGAPIALTPGVGIPSVHPNRWYVAPDGTLQTTPIALRHDAVLTPGAVLDLSGLAIDYTPAFPPTTES